MTINHGGADTEVTETEYDQSRMSKQIAVNSTTGDQETVYTWGVAPAVSKIASHDLLQKMTYPDGGVVQYQYNRQSVRIKMTDPNDNVHDYQLDKLGRMTEDRVTLAGGSIVDDAVLRIVTADDNRMRLLNKISRGCQEIDLPNQKLPFRLRQDKTKTIEPVPRDARFTRFSANFQISSHQFRGRDIFLLPPPPTI